MANNDDVTRNHPPPPPPPPPMYSQPPHTASFNPAVSQQGNEQLKSFWYQQMEAVEDFKTHQLPLARIKKIMKSDRDVRMISAEAPIVFAKACEMFIVDLTMRSWLHAEGNKRRTLHKSDISAAVARAFAFDFLLDVVPRDDSIAADHPGYFAVPHPDGGGQYYYPPVVDGNGLMYAAQTAQSSWPSHWAAVSGGDGEEEAGQSQSGGNSGGN